MSNGKKSILFVNDSLYIGGGEKSLISLLSLMDYSRYNVDLLLFQRGGEFEQFLPSEVNVIDPPASWTNLLSTSVSDLVIKGRMNEAVSRLHFSLKVRLLRKRKTVRDRNQLFWSCFNNYIKGPDKEYDVAVAYSQGVPTFFVAEKVNSSKKIGWINVYYDLKDYQRQFQEKFYSLLDGIVIVSENAHEVFCNVYPQFKEKMLVIHDICNSDLLFRMAENQIKDMPADSTTRLLTVARLDYHFKGLDITARACELLAQRGLDFKWYFVGDGQDRVYLENYIQEHHLQDRLILLGAKSNPYPYFKNCDIYVQTSRQEGWGISLVEARLFNKPVVATEFSTVWNQMVQMKNGIVTDFEPDHVADAVEKLMSDKELYLSLVDYLKQEKKGNAEELLKFDSLLDS